MPVGVDEQVVLGPRLRLDVGLVRVDRHAHDLDRRGLAAALLALEHEHEVRADRPQRGEHEAHEQGPERRVVVAVEAEQGAQLAERVAAPWTGKARVACPRPGASPAGRLDHLPTVGGDHGDHVVVAAQVEHQPGAVTADAQRGRPASLTAVRHRLELIERLGDRLPAGRHRHLAAVLERRLVALAVGREQVALDLAARHPPAAARPVLFGPAPRLGAVVPEIELVLRDGDQPRLLVDLDLALGQPLPAAATARSQSRSTLCGRSSSCSPKK